LLKEDVFGNKNKNITVSNYQQNKLFDNMVRVEPAIDDSKETILNKQTFREKLSPQVVKFIKPDKFS